MITELISHMKYTQVMSPWTVAHQALLSMEVSKQEYWSELPFPSPINQYIATCKAKELFSSCLNPSQSLHIYIVVETNPYNRASERNITKW